jgi:uncharacterized protein DUF222
MCSGSGVRGSWTSEQAFKEINSILDQLADEDLTAVPAEAMGDDQIALQRICNRVQAEALRRLRRFDKGQGYASSMALSTKAWLRWKCNLTYGVASNQVEVARRLATLPQTSRALADGDISYRHASLIAGTAEQLGERMEAHAEEILVTAGGRRRALSRRAPCRCIDRHRAASARQRKAARGRRPETAPDDHR